MENKPKKKEETQNEVTHDDLKAFEERLHSSADRILAQRKAREEARRRKEAEQKRS